MRYHSFHLTIESELPLPELTGSDAVGTPDVRIVRGRVPAEGLADGEQKGPFLWVGNGTLWLRVPDVARFLIRDGKEILVDTEKDADDDSVRVFLLGSAMGALLTQRDWLVLHGNAVRVGDHALVCVGDSGTGKSTLATGFMRRGHPVLSDDLVPIDPDGRALPGPPRIKLWQDMATQLDIDTRDLRRIRPGLEKFHLPLDDDRRRVPIPVRWIYVLDTHPGDNITLNPIEGLERFPILHDNSFRLRFIKGMGRESEHLAQCAQLAARVRLARVTRPSDGFSLEGVLDLILQDAATHP
ncbi:MAG: hypothetical protein ACPGU7_00275 [Gammaproteobacteria bacterium]